ncbi:MAG: adenylyltransferase/cytidyltransferase family protein [Candidatus Gracilibacteria bacterium]|nr:adenylyltransferase/cytidyltransferase family protein [Candidatus Gracilibacteria bacterium]
MKEESKKKLVMVFGTFDYLHAGHENLFKQAKELGTEVIAIIARDKTVRTIKGADPDHDEKTRLENLKATSWTEKAILGDAKDKMKAIKIYRPDIIALGYDQFAFTYKINKLLLDLNLNAKIIRLKPYRPDMYKSSIIKNSLSEKKDFEVIKEATV